MTTTDVSFFPEGFDSVGAFFRDYPDAALNTARSYFTERSGRYFDEIARQGNPYRLDGSEVAAATCLSLRFDHERVARLFSIADLIENELAHIPTDLHLWDAPDEFLDVGSPLANAYALIDGLEGFGTAYTSKILAAKRPHLVPIRDHDVSRLMGDPRRWWRPWRAVMSQSDLRLILERIRADLHLPHVSLLRVADAVLWEIAVGGAPMTEDTEEGVE